ncbi:high affinity copper uptake protein 1-like [Sorex fumeus]|uniref:high affinity copper uptake protein 1-like n=1 Tax=Sorex fumeus TaxID=62283 RepID=UPI0024ADC19D|nr:high affinity copper uptake protein 1-like [Sorex fumeus]XP_055968936.1 high affinity copper uptake protein 1-like [Sorex fumeus]XP_055968977.1 high affinity copper uptake protein 1-like [Sorex fumeus]XP_055968996.1 high affinity copper uptake protein 1-like [Sorex fumeus]XP_055969037.1 high affinity copper uptake protein 1-like [Sorex fumeus]
MMMPTAFYFGYQNVELLFPGVVMNSPTDMVLAVLAIFILAVCSEGLKLARENLPLRAASGQRWQLLSWPHLVQTLLHVLQVLLTYVLMLTVMTYNAYFALAVLVGVSVGYLLFRWKKTMHVDPDLEDPCH